MIHYTLLPEQEIKSLRREYRARFFVVSLFFLSWAVIVGVIALVPAYILSHSQEKAALETMQKLEKGKKESATTNIVSEFSSTNTALQKLKESQQAVAFSSIIAEIISHKTSQVSLTSFDIEKTPATASSSLNVVLQGKAATREALVTFKKNLESDIKISNIELPLSDLAKSKDILFALRFTIQ